MKKFFFFIIGIVLIAVVIYLGIRTSQDTTFVVWFGLASAILAPIAFALIGHGFRADELQFFQELAKVPKIDNLIKEAKTQEEKIALLEQERNNLNEIIQVEARRQTLLSSIDNIQHEITRVLKHYNAVIDELTRIDIKIEESPAVQEMKLIQKRIEERRRGKIIILKFRKREFIIHEKRFSNNLINEFLLIVLKILEDMQIKFYNKKSKKNLKIWKR